MSSPPVESDIGGKIDRKAVARYFVPPTSYDIPIDSECPLRARYDFLPMKNATKIFAVLCLVISGSVLFGAANPKSTLSIAHELAGTVYKGKTYADVDCVQFVLAVAQEKLGLTFNTEIRNAILISHGWTEKQTQEIAAASTDPRLDGVAYALIELSKHGKPVSAVDARPGDLIQYWMKTSKGNWFGHSGVIASVNKNRAVIFGSHQSQNGIGDSSFKLDLSGVNRRIAVVRIE